MLIIGEVVRGTVTRAEVYRLYLSCQGHEALVLIPHPPSERSKGTGSSSACRRTWPSAWSRRGVSTPGWRGARWRHRNARAMAALICCRHTDQWDLFWGQAA